MGRGLRKQRKLSLYKHRESEAFIEQRELASGDKPRSLTPRGGRGTQAFLHPAAMLVDGFKREIYGKAPGRAHRQAPVVVHQHVNVLAPGDPNQFEMDAIALQRYLSVLNDSARRHFSLSSWTTRKPRAD